MRTTQELYYPVLGQSLFHDADLRPASVTSVEVQENREGDDASPEAATTGSATIDAVNTTIDATSGYDQTDPRVVHLTSVAGIVKSRTYLLTSTLGMMEWGLVEDILAGSVILRHPLQNEYLATSTFQGTRITIAVDATWVAAIANITGALSPEPRYRTRWEYVVGSDTIVRATNFDLVRYSASHGVLGIDVDSFFPGFLKHLPPEYREGQGAKLIQVAFVAVKFDLRKAAKRMAMARDPEAVDILVIYKTNELHQMNRLERGGGTLEAVESARDAYHNLYNNLVVEPNMPFATDSGGAAAASVDRSPVFVR